MICRDPFTHVKSYKIWTLWNRNLPKKNQWLCSFTFLTLPWLITSRSSTVVWADQAQQNCCYSLIMHGLKDLDETVSEGGKVRVLVEIETASIFRLDILGRVGGQKPIGPTWAHRTEPKSGQNPTGLWFNLCLLSCLPHLGIHLIISSHTSI